MTNLKCTSTKRPICDEFDEFGGDEYDSFLDEEDYEYFDEEGDEFWGALKGIAKKVGGVAKSAAKKLAPLAKAHAGKIGTLIGGALGGPAGAAIGGGIGRVVKNMEDEDDFDSEDEMEAVLPISPTDGGLAEAMAASAVKSRPSDAQALGGALAITIMSKTPLTVKTVAPGIATASGRIARSMATSQASRQLIKALPTIVNKTAATLNQKARKGKPVTTDHGRAGDDQTCQAHAWIRSAPRPGAGAERSQAPAVEPRGDLAVGEVLLSAVGCPGACAPRGSPFSVFTAMRRPLFRRN